MKCGRLLTFPVSLPRDDDSSKPSCPSLSSFSCHAVLSPAALSGCRPAVEHPLELHAPSVCPPSPGPRCPLLHLFPQPTTLTLPATGRESSLIRLRETPSQIWGSGQTFMVQHTPPVLNVVARCLPRRRSHCCEKEAPAVPFTLLSGTCSPACLKILPQQDFRKSLSGGGPIFLS